MALLAGGCFKEKLADDAGGNPRNPGSANRAPTISGTPPTSVVAGQVYSFTPSATDPDGDPLTFSIQSQPSWATFNGSTGRLQGTPGAGDVGQFTNVRITVADGHGAQATLNAFSISVNQIANGSVTLSWMPPTTNVDGTTLTDLAGYRIYYGRSADQLDQTVTITNAGTTRWVVENLWPATWYFAITSYRTGGVESAPSPTVSRTLT